MTRISCDVVQDILPLYHDDVCSAATRELVEEHLVECEDCRSYLEQIKSSFNVPVQAMEQNQLEVNGLQRFKRMWSRAQSAAFVKGLIVTASVAGILFLGYWGLFRWNVIPVASDDISISNIRLRPNGEIAFLIQIKDGYGADRVIFNLHDDGGYYITPVHPVIRLNKSPNFNFVSGELFTNPDNVRAYEKKKHGKDVEITSIYYGPPNNPILVWKKGDKLPVRK
ncbi:hypothetical protein D3C75_785550 [compost metagenome]